MQGTEGHTQDSGLQKHQESILVFLRITWATEWRWGGVPAGKWELASFDLRVPLVREKKARLRPICPKWGSGSKGRTQRPHPLANTSKADTVRPQGRVRILQQGFSMVPMETTFARDLGSGAFLAQDASPRDFP